MAQCKPGESGYQFEWVVMPRWTGGISIVSHDIQPLQWGNPSILQHPRGGGEFLRLATWQVCVWTLVLGTYRGVVVVMVPGFLSSLVELEHRIDFELREGLVESRYWSAVTSHTAYWSSMDVALFLLTFMYKQDHEEDGLKSHLNTV